VNCDPLPVLPPNATMALSNLGEGECDVGMKRRTKKPLDSSAARIVAYLDGLQGKVNAMRELQSTSGEELRRSRTLMPSVLDRAFKGEL
jgi:hypothetical protein